MVVIRVRSEFLNVQVITQPLHNLKGQTSFIDIVTFAFHCFFFYQNQWINECARNILSLIPQDVDFCKNSRY